MQGRRPSAGIELTENIELTGVELIEVYCIW